MLKRKKPDPPGADELEFASSGSRVMYQYIIDLYTRVGRLEGTQKVILGLVLAVLGALISVALKVFGG